MTDYLGESYTIQTKQTENQIKNDELKQTEK
jgi:hypothetical protein